MPRRPQLLGGAERGPSPRLPAVCPPRTGTYASPPFLAHVCSPFFQHKAPARRAWGGWQGRAGGHGVLPGGLQRGGYSLVLVLRPSHQELRPQIPHAPGIKQGTFAQEKPRLDPASPETWEKWVRSWLGLPKTKQPPNLDGPTLGHQPRAQGRPWGRIQPRSRLRSRHVPAAAAGSPRGSGADDNSELSPCGARKQPALRAGPLRARTARLAVGFFFSSRALLQQRVL